MNKKIILIVLLAALLGVATWQGLRLILPPEVTVVKMTTGPAVDAVYATGTVEPSILVPIAPRTTSRLTTLNSDEGKEVKKGDVLAQMEDTDLQANIKELQAKLDFAETDFRRKDSLYRSKSISQDVHDTAKSARDTLQAQLSAAQAKADYFRLVAPADGTIIKRDGEVGEIIAAGTPVFYFTCCAPLRISAEVDEESIADVKEGQTVLIQSDNFKDKIFHGKVTAITPKGDPISRSYRVRISFDEADNPFMIGMTTETNIILHQSDNANLVPTLSIGPKGNIQKVENGHIVISTPRIGSKGTEDTEILDGVSASDILVTPYNKDLKDGDAVRTKMQQPSSAKP